VRSIELQECDNDEKWRRSLTSAILRASPLSAPPEQWLFAANITLAFSGEQYSANRTSEHAYEPVPRRVAAIEHPSGLSPIPEKDSDFELTNSGSGLRWVKKSAPTVADE
jgi:hypothetical protein